jgi:hypothetical protein
MNEVTYPKTYRSRSTGIVVLFTGLRTGVELAGPEGESHVGEYSTEWPPCTCSNWEPMPDAVRVESKVIKTYGFPMLCKNPHGEIALFTDEHNGTLIQGSSDMGYHYAPPYRLDLTFWTPVDALEVTP